MPRHRPATAPKKKQGNTESEYNAGALPHSRRPAGAGGAAEGIDLFGNSRIQADRARLYRIGPAIVSRMTGKQGHEAMKFLSAMVKAARDDCGRVLEVFREAEKREPLMIPAAFLMDRARGSRLAPVSGTPRSDRLEGYFTRPAPDERPAFDVEGTIFQETTA